MSQYAYLASKLDSMKEGDGTVLDNTCLMFLSNLWIGRKHDNFRVPLVLAGAVAVGPDAATWMGEVTLAIRAKIPVTVLADVVGSTDRFVSF